MKFYLSSYKLGNAPNAFADLLTQGKWVAYIPNALDFADADLDRIKAIIAEDVESLEELHLDVKILDLKQYFHSPPGELKSMVDSFSGLWVSGGDVFVLRQAMRLSGIDKIISAKRQQADFVYGGYSAGCCVLSESLKSYQFASDANAKPYPELTSTIWTGLGLIDFAFMPHFQSEHSESDLIDQEIAYCEANNIRYKPVKDGHALVF